MKLDDAMSNRAQVAHALDQADMLELFLTVEQAAIYADVGAQQIRDWKRRGHLQAWDYVGPRRRPVFRALDVLRARDRAADNLARTQAQNLASTRESVTA